jgi:sugar phosphate isomerase/epimerase
VRCSRRELALGLLSTAPLLLGMARRSPRTVRLGVSTYSYRDMLPTAGSILEKMIAATRALDLRIVELWDATLQPPDYANGAAWQVLPNGEASPASIAGHPPEGPLTAAQIVRRDRVRQWRLETPISHFVDIGRQFANAGIEIQAFASDIKEEFSDAEIDRTFEIARAVDAGVLNTSTTLTMAERVVPFAARHKMRVGMHGHSNVRDPNQIATPASFERCLAMSPWYVINLDIGHFSAAGFDPVAFLEQHHERTTSIHVKDRKRADGPNMPYGKGDTPIVEVVRRIRDRHWNIALIIEYEYAGGRSIEAVRACRDYVDAALA